MAVKFMVYVTSLLLVICAAKEVVLKNEDDNFVTTARDFDTAELQTETEVTEKKENIDKISHRFGKMLVGNSLEDELKETDVQMDGMTIKPSDETPDVVTEKGVPFQKKEITTESTTDKIQIDNQKQNSEDLTQTSNLIKNSKGNVITDARVEAQNQKSETAKDARKSDYGEEDMNEMGVEISKNDQEQLSEYMTQRDYQDKTPEIVAENGDVIQNQKQQERTAESSTVQTDYQSKNSETVTEQSDEILHDKEKSEADISFVNDDDKNDVIDDRGSDLHNFKNEAQKEANLHNFNDVIDNGDGYTNEDDKNDVIDNDELEDISEIEFELLAEAMKEKEKQRKKTDKEFIPIPMPTSFESYDINNDDAIDKEELIRVTGAWKNVDIVFDVADSNDDNKISRTEFYEAPLDLSGKIPER